MQQQTQFAKKRSTTGTKIARYGQSGFTAATATAAPAVAVAAAPVAAPLAGAPAPRRPLLSVAPVLGPLVAVLAITGMWRGGQTLASLVKGGIGGGAAVTSSALAAAGAKNPTEKTIAGYVQAGKMAKQGRDAEGLEAVRALEGTPLVVDRGGFIDRGIGEFSPSVNLMHAADAFAERAKAAAKIGDAETAARWLEACQSLSAHVARSDRPTIEALTTLHYVDDRLARARREVLGGTLGHILEGQRQAMNRFWRDTVVREMGETWTARMAQVGVSNPEVEAAQEKADGELASRLMTRYLAEQARLQATASNLGIAPVLPPSV
jgi:hypothetical protein